MNQVAERSVTVQRVEYGNFRFGEQAIWIREWNGEPLDEKDTEPISISDWAMIKEVWMQAGRKIIMLPPVIKDYVSIFKHEGA